MLQDGIGACTVVQPRPRRQPGRAGSAMPTLGRLLCALALCCGTVACCKCKPVKAKHAVATQAAQPAAAAPVSALDARLATLPDPLARVDGRPIARAMVGSGLRAQVDGGVLSATADDITWQRAVATRLETRIDMFLVARALDTQQRQVATASAQALLTAEQARSGGKNKWLDTIRLRGETAAMRMDALALQRGLALLARKDPAVAVPEHELRERFESQNKALAETGRPPLTFAAARGSLHANLLRMREFAAGRMLLAGLRAAAHIERMPPFDHPPGGLPLAGTVTATLPEPDDD